MSWEDKVRKVEPYVAGEQPKDKGVIKLNTNECPYPPAPGVMIAAQVLRDSYSDLRLYPDMDATMLVNALAEYYQVDPDQIFVGVGSDDVLALCFLTFFTNGSPILFPDITYSFYDVWADLYGISYENPALQEDFSIRAEDYLPAVAIPTVLSSLMKPMWTSADRLPCLFWRNMTTCWWSRPSPSPEPWPESGSALPSETKK